MEIAHFLTQPVASCFQGSVDVPSWKMCNFRMGMGFCYIPMYHSSFSTQETVISKMYITAVFTDAIEIYALFEGYASIGS